MLLLLRSTLKRASLSHTQHKHAPQLHKKIAGIIIYFNSQRVPVVHTAEAFLPFIVLHIIKLSTLAF